MTSNILLYAICWYIVFNISYPLYKFYIKSTTIIFTNIFFLSLIIYCCSNYYYNMLIYNQTISFSPNWGPFLFIGINLGLSFNLNLLSFYFLFLIILIGCGANIYTLTYFKGEVSESKFIWFLNLFIISMLIFILAENFFTLFLGWELIGLTSFFLINFWFLKISTLKAAFKAFTFNLISDILLLGSLACFYLASSTTVCSEFLGWVTTTYFNSYNFYFFSYTYLGTILLILCSSIKSVQILNHLWLPDSMEAPVPASSLIHSATLISAGIFLLCKFNILITLFNLCNILSFFGALTACYGGLVASQQTDLKKLLAYSTMSHCGFVWFLVSNSLLNIALFYLFLHGVFKACTFFCAGSFIRNNNTQDMRWMCVGSVSFPVDSILLIICSANLAGLPLSIGYFYKKIFLTVCFNNTSGLFILSLLSLGLLSSVVYFYNITKFVLFNVNRSVCYTSNIANNINYKIDDNYSIVSINLLISLMIIIIPAIIWIFFNFNFLETCVFLDFNPVELLINKYCTQILININSFLFFYGLFIILFIILFLNFWKVKHFAVEITSGLLFLFFIVLFLTCEVL